ncbi:MAG: glycosyltransferase [bacterium]|nr:glycosyltransferase [bacterium]
MALLLTVFTLIYSLAAVALAVFASAIFVLLILWWVHRRRVAVPPLVDEAHWPQVTVQIPIYNEAAVVERVLLAAAALDYPREKLHLQLLDDSDDDTADLAAALTAELRAQGVNLDHIRRPQRVGYKAGALAYGLTLTDAPFIAIFDADFVPPPDFLRQTIPYFLADDQLGIVQTRWAHLNPTQNLITRTQAMSIDAHFVVEQTARSRGGLLLSFNGTGGIWRRAAIDDAGGWSHATLAEDLDLSYRAQMRGWRYLYLPDVAVPAELPPQIAAYKRQQARWAKGTTQNLLRHLGDLWRNPRLNVFQKGMGTLHLCQYLPQPLILLMTLLTPPLLLAGVAQNLPLGFLGITGLAAPLMYLVSQQVLYRDWPRRMIAFPLLIAVGSGVSLNNTVAVIEALLRRPSIFKRTPKFSDQAWTHNRYALRLEWTFGLEVALALYTALGGLLALRLAPGLAPFLFGQTYGFSAIVLWSLWDEARVRRLQRQNALVSERAASTIDKNSGSDNFSPSPQTPLPQVEGLNNQTLSPHAKPIDGRWESGD